VSGIGTSCLTCHTTAPHPVAAHWRSTATIAQPTTHTTTDVNNATVCSACHNSTQKNLSQPYLARFASSPAGSFNAAAPVTCFNAGLCHGDVRKIINCDACHSIATSNPFRSMAGATAATDSKVGAHVKHLNASVQSPAYSANISCSECHAVPVSPDISGAHRNGSNDVPLSGTLARTGSLSPSYSAATGVCANTYCHGTTLTGGGSNKAPVWNQANYLAAGCGTCHGYPPTTVRNGAAAHSTSSACSGCHSHINAANNGFSDAAKHINGIVEASGGGHGGAPYPGASHKSQTTSGCFGCHPANAAGSTYPATSGTPPNCRGCHLNANPGTDPQCSDCHGSVANNGSATLAGRPVAGGTAFPNRPGEHNRSQHVGRACTVCHPFTTGDARHGWSNRVKSTAAQVGGAGTSITSWNATTKSCTPTCHSSETW
jgi:predicted CxxxxCH...CXXCH cytochrome family protein